MTPFFHLTSRLFFNSLELFHVSLIRKPRLFPPAFFIKLFVPFMGYGFRFLMLNSSRTLKNLEGIGIQHLVYCGFPKAIRRLTRNSAVSRKIIVSRLSVSISSWLR